MSNDDRGFTIDLTAPSGVLYLQGLKVRHPRAALFMARNGRRIIETTRAHEACVHAHTALLSPRSLLVVSYWTTRKGLMSFLATPLHIELRRTTTEHPDWFDLWNETYEVPMSANYWNAPDGYALTQSPEHYTARSVA